VYHAGYFCKDRELAITVPDNPLKNLRMPKKPQRIPRAIEPDDFDKMLAAAQTKRGRAILLVLRDTGCRVSELCNKHQRHSSVARMEGQARSTARDALPIKKVQLRHLA